MNKQELIEKYQDKLYEVCTNYGEYYRTIAYENILKDLENLDEPQKPVVPQFVADYIKYAIENDWDFQDLFKCIEDEEDEKEPDETVNLAKELFGEKVVEIND